MLGLLYFVEMSRKMTGMNEVNQFASVISGIVENLNILLCTLEYPSRLRPRDYISAYSSVPNKMFRFSTMISNN